jgi:hypothetical protein
VPLIIVCGVVTPHPNKLNANGYLTKSLAYFWFCVGDALVSLLHIRPYFRLRRKQSTNSISSLLIEFCCHSFFGSVLDIFIMNVQYSRRWRNQSRNKVCENMSHRDRIGVLLACIICTTRACKEFLIRGLGSPSGVGFLIFRGLAPLTMFN